MDARIAEAIRRSDRWYEQMSGIIEPLKIPTHPSIRIPASLFHLAMDHDTAIRTLASNDLVGSAFALFRPLFEAYVRGIWCHLCATPEAMIRFINSDAPPINAMITAVESTEAFRHGELRQLKNGMWSNLCELTHGGMMQVAMRWEGDKIAERIDPQHAAALVNAAANISYLAALGIARLIESGAVALRLRDVYFSLYGDLLNAGAPV
jgi:hypothetical protein